MFSDFRRNTWIMSNWKYNDIDPEKDLVSVGALFELGKIKRMYDISSLYPTKVTKLLGINHERYTVKLANPDKFSVSEVLKMSYIFNVDPALILEVIQKETEKLIVSKIESQKTKLK